MNDTTPLTDGYVTTDDIAGQMIRMSHQLAGHPGGSEWRSWRHDLLTSMLDHPFSDVRCDLAAYGSLALLRKAAIHPDPAVRYAATFNRYVVDVDVQNTLAGDIRHEIVEALIERVDLGREAIQIIIDGPHVDARLMLAQRRIGTELLAQLAEDEDIEVRDAATAALGRTTRLAA